MKLFAIGGIEILLVILFIIIKPSNIKINVKSVLRGVIERLVLVIGMLNGYPQILIVFGTLKIGSRLHEAKSDESFNNFYLTGNLISILAAILYVNLIDPERKLIQLISSM